MSKAAGPYDLIVIGGGAAGFFGAITAAEAKPGLRVLILEKTSKLLSKVKISGGGRCNVTHHCFEATPLSKHYPRGQKALKQLFRQFQATDVINWFEGKGISLKTEADGRMFPMTDNSQTIIDCFLDCADKLNIRIEMNAGVQSLAPSASFFRVVCEGEKQFQGDKILVAIGGHIQARSYQSISRLGHAIKPLIPSLFTFNDSQKEMKDLMGISVPNALVKIAGTKFFEIGPLLITHWGLSGPAIIKLSAWAAEYLHETGYHFVALVSWIGEIGEDDLRNLLLNRKNSNPKQKITGHPLFDLPQRLWLRLCEIAEIDPAKLWGELPHKNLNRLIEFLIRCPFTIDGKTTFKEEFVTCGGVDLNEVELTTMESKKVKNLYFAGEVLNIDGETGGFNFQAAWTTAFVAAQSISRLT